MSSILKWMSCARRQPLPPRVFSNNNYKRIAADLKIEEETLPTYVASHYYPVRIGEVFRQRYQVVGKLGYGATSTAWLARDLNQHNHVTLKIYVHSGCLGSDVNHELAVYQRLASGPSHHPGKGAVRSLLDHFAIPGPDGEHQCLVHPPLWESVAAFLRRIQGGKLPMNLLRMVLVRLFAALDYIHNECHIIHTDINANNIMWGFDDDTILENFETAEMQDPTPRKELDGRVTYVSRQVPQPDSMTAPVLCDFGSAVFGGGVNTHCVQPTIYRAPEVLLQVPWAYSIDIWSVGCLIWDISVGGHLFLAYDPELQKYSNRCHFAEMIALLGPPPLALLQQGNRTQLFFANDGTFNAGVDIPDTPRIENVFREGADEDFKALIISLLRWAPEDRSTARDLQHHEWLRKGL